MNRMKSTGKKKKRKEKQKQKKTKQKKRENLTKENKILITRNC